jgi:hypothetical protein
MLRTLALALLLSAPLAARAGDKDKPAEPKKDLPVTAKLVAAKTTYTLDLDGKTGEEFRKMLKEAKGNFPKAPAVELTLELKNTSDKPVKIWIGGDPTRLDLDLTGKGAVNVDAQRFFTRIFYAPKELELGPGKSHKIKITALQYGFRGIAKRAYWTEPGDYKLSASFVTAINPAPTGVKADDKGFGRVTITSPKITLKVEKK